MASEISLAVFCFGVVGRVHSFIIEVTERGRGTSSNCFVYLFRFSMEMGQKENNIAKIKATISQHLPDAEIMLFGSIARRDAQLESDYDILVKVRDQITAREKIILRTNIRKELLKKDIRSDILIQSDEEIERKKNLPGHIIRNLMKDAVIL